MRPLVVLNDIHLGVQRLAGTTLHSANMLRQAQFDWLNTMLIQTTDDLLINGDLFDTFTVDSLCLLRTYSLFSSWLTISSGTLYLARGNHDYQPKADKISSFDLLASLLKAAHAGRVVIITEPTLICEKRRFYVIPHMPNQDMFDEALHDAGDLSNHVLFLHANYDNHFAVQSDHSLNVSEAQAKAHEATGNLLFFGHEHQKRVMLGGSVYIAGNQWPSSVADCLAHGEAQKDGNKYAHVITVTDTGPQIEAIPTWSGDAFTMWDWQRLREGDMPDPDTYQFIRVCGDALAEEGEEVVNLIARLRKVSNAFVITNAVRVGGVQGIEDLANTTFEAIKSFNVLEALLEQLDERERAVIKELLE